MNQLVSSGTPLRYQFNISETPFVDSSLYDDPFSFRDITDLFKKKEGSGSASTGDTEPAGTGTKTGNVFGSIFTGLFGVGATLAPLLPSLGIGSKSRIEEAEAIAKANASIYDAQTAASLAALDSKNKQSEQLMIIGGALLLVLIFFMVIMKR